MKYERKPIENLDSLKAIRLSPSSINTFRQCPRRWFNEYILALSSEQSIHLLRGSVIHTTLENMFNLKNLPSGEQFRPRLMSQTLQIFNDEWDKEIKDFDFNEKQKIIFYDESKFIIERFVNRFCDNIQSAIKARKISNEGQGFYLMRPKFKELWLDDQFKADKSGKKIMELNDDNKSEKIPIEDSLGVGGFIDSVQKDFDNNTILIDYKTSTKYKNVLSDDYVLQLSIYAYLWQKQFGELPTYVGINYLKYDESFYIMVTPSLINKAISIIKDTRRQIEEFELDKNKYYKHETKLCDWCPFIKECMVNKDE